MTGSAYDYFMYFLEKHSLRSRRERLLSGLSGKVLEVGVGTGANFEHYGEDIELTGIEPSPCMLPKAESRRNRIMFPDRITLHNIGCGYPEMEKLMADGSLDAVVCTLVLCTIPDPERALSNFKKWLKPGGRLLILEHIRGRNRFYGKVLDVLNPAWEKMAEGCRLNRNTDKIIAEAGFRVLREDRFNLFLPFSEAEYEKPRNA